MDYKEKNKFARKLLHCPKCNRVLAEIRGNQIYLMKYIKGEPHPVKVEVEHDAGGKFRIECECGGCFERAAKALKMTYAIKK